MEANERKAGVILSYLYTGLNFLIGLAYIPILLNFLGESEFGLYQLIGSMIAYLAIMDFGLAGTTTRYYSKYIALNDKKSQENVLAISSIIYLVLGCLIFIVGFIGYEYLDVIFGNSLSMKEIELAEIMFIIMVINIGISVPSQISTTIINSNERFIFIKVLLIIQVILRPILVVSVLYMDANVVNIVLVESILNFFVILVKFYFCFIILRVKIKLHNWDSNLFKGIISFSFFVFLAGLIDQIFWKTDQIILGAIDGTASVAIYAIASQIVLSYMSLSTAVSGVFLPKITKMVTEGATNTKLTDIFTRIGRLQFFLLSCVLSGFILYGKQFIEVWAGESFGLSYYICIIILVPFTIDLIQNIGLSILLAKNLYSYRAKMFLVIAILNVICSIPLVIYYGAIGAAIATGISYLIGNILMNIFYLKYIKLDISNFWRNIFGICKPLLLVMIIGVVINNINFLPEIPNLIIKLSFYTLVFVLIMWKFAMNEYERRIFAGILKKMTFRLK